MIAMEELLSLKWNNHRSTFLHILAVLRDKQLYTDVTIACDGKFYNVHKMVLSTCSDYFSAMFDKTAGKVPIIVLKDIKSEDLEALLDYMYLGEVNVRQSDLASLIKSAECLRIKGLAVPDDEPPKKVSSNNLGVNKVETNKRTDSSFTSPPPKKKRKESDDGREDVRPVPLPIPPPPPQAESPPLVKPSPAQLNNSKDSLPPESIPDLPPVKQEMEEPDDDGGQETYDISDDHDHYKEEMEDPPDLSNELPDFLQSSSSYQSNFPSTSFQPDMLSWQGDQNFSSLNYGAAASSSNDPGGNVGILPPVSADPICEVCGKTFNGRNWKQNKQYHMFKHTGIKSFRCPLCDHMTSLKSNLVRHMKCRHVNEMMYQQQSTSSDFNAS